jgi:hypothetical protein
MSNRLRLCFVVVLACGSNLVACGGGSSGTGTAGAGGGSAGSGGTAAAGHGGTGGAAGSSAAGAGGAAGSSAAGTGGAAGSSAAGAGGAAGSSAAGTGGGAGSSAAGTGGGAGSSGGGAGGGTAGGGGAGGAAGGTAGGGGAQGCNAITNSATEIAETRVAAAMPTNAIGGTPLAGTYYQVSHTIYTGPGGATGPNGNTRKVVAVLTANGAGFSEQLVQQVNGTEDRATAALSISDKTLMVTISCPASGGGTSLPFSVNGDDITIFDVQSSAVQVHRRQP